MEYNNKKEKEKESEEGIINMVPKSINISNKFLCDKNTTPHKFYRKNSLSINTLNIPSNIGEKDYTKNSILNIVRVDKYKYNLKFEDSNSTATKSSINDKLKKVTFSTVEIIRVENYKKYNKLNAIKRSNNNSWIDYNNCLIF